ncbi:DUF2530 domain-containing protein [Jiangella gansuensis]|uniref:DUF2530 domain-containing protein n=1 Tax=Jiangella gansuensis TaxID=281473 RepID=UPI0004B5C5B5|nr:DUF2530 domain-containing protein [Jiangella gansuensis]
MGRRRRRTEAAPEVEPDEVKPLDVDGVRTVAVLTILWAVAFVLLALRMDSLEAEGRGWWLWTCLAGVGLGLLGLEYTRKRRDAINEPEDEEQFDAGRHDAEPVEAEPVETEAVTRPIDTGADLPPVRTRTDLPPVRDTRADLPPVDGPEPGPTYGPTTRPGPAGPERPTDPGRTADSGADRPAGGERPRTPDRPSMDDRPASRDSSPPTGRNRTVRQGSGSELFGDLGVGATPPSGTPSGAPSGDDEPLLDTTLSGRRARDDDKAEEIDEITEGGTQYRGRRARRSDTA